MFNLFSTLTRPFKIRRLKKEYNMLYGSSGTAAEQSLRRQMAYLQKKNPVAARSGIWKRLFMILNVTGACADEEGLLRNGGTSNHAGGR